MQRYCFVIIPFIPELNFFYLYLKKHIEENHPVACFRGDKDVLTIPVNEKTKKYIESAELIIADCTGNNPNVFYELGIAHALNKKVILLSMNEAKEIPIDVRHFELIFYRLDKHVEFLEKIDNALQNVFSETYEQLFKKALQVLEKFNTAYNLHIKPVEKRAFIQKVRFKEKKQLVPDLTDEKLLENFLLPLIIDTKKVDVHVREKITQWVTNPAL